MKTFNTLNEDSINMIETPVNPLLEKWLKLYPKKKVCIMLEENNVENYGCINCDKCPEGYLFEIPNEDLEEYKEYLKKLDEYKKINQEEEIKGIKRLLFKRASNN